MAETLTLLAGIATILSGLGVLQAMAGWGATARFARRPAIAVTNLPPISVLKPLHGDEPLLEAALASVCQQDYPCWQVVFGVGSTADTALPVARRLQQRFPACDIAIVVDPTRHGANGKVGNLINMLPAAKHDVLVIADSDLHVTPDWLTRLAAALQQAPDVGLVTTLYSGLPATPLLWPRLGALQINQYFLPGALLARAMGRQDCLGATMALRRDTLQRVGGLRALVDHLADDNVLGRLVQRLRLKVALADTVPATTVPETSFNTLWRHELRWARTIRKLAPLPFAASVLQYPLIWAALAIIWSAGVWSVAWFAAAWLLRGLAARGIEQALGLAIRSPVWLLPVRELMSVAIMVASYAGRQVDWRGHTLHAEGFDPR